MLSNFPNPLTDPKPDPESQPSPNTMRFFASYITLLLLSISTALAANVGRENVEVASKPKPPKVCDPKAKGSNLAQLQYEALADFANLFVVKQDVLTAFNRYVPG